MWKADLPLLTDMMCVIYEYSLDADRLLLLLQDNTACNCVVKSLAGDTAPSVLYSLLTTQITQ